MAFCKSLGGLLRQGAVSQTGNVPVQSMLGSLRYMSTKLFVGGKYLVFVLMKIELFYLFWKLVWLVWYWLVQVSHGELMTSHWGRLSPTSVKWSIVSNGCTLTIIVALGESLFITLCCCCAAKVIVDRETGRSRGFGFVNFSDESAANAAISEMDGKVCVWILI